SHRLLPILTFLTDDEKARCAEIVIRFNPGYTPRQLTSGCQIGEALDAGEITLTPANRLFKCKVEEDQGLPSKDLFIVTQPQTQTLQCGTNIIFSVTVGGKGTFTFQWRLCDRDIPGATDRLLIISDADPAAL